MRALWAVYKRETALFFRSFIAYAIIFALLGFIGLLFMSTINDIQQQQAFNPQGGGIPATDLITFNLSLFTFLMFVTAPLLTMRLLSEETREGTLEVLMTLPMGEWAFVLGKFLAVWTFYSVILALTLVHTALLVSLGPINLGLALAAYFGAWLYGGAALAISIIWSAITEDQLVAAFLGAASILIIFLTDRFAILINDQQLVAGASDFVRELGFSPHYQATLLQGIVRAQDVVYFILVMIVALFVTTLIVGTRRWRAA